MATSGWKILAALIVAAAAAPTCVFAQQTQPETVRGKVTDDSSRVIAGATVMVTRGPDRLTQQGVTDSSGTYRVHFEQGTGDYLVYVSATGYRSARRRVQRQSSERELVADFTLGKDIAKLDAIKVQASKPVRAANGISPFQPETGSSESWKDGVSGSVSPTNAGDLNAIAGTMSNVTVTPGGISIAGSGAESNLGTLNGMGFPGGGIPRAAKTETRVTGATFDATRGGFAGANVDVRLGPGDRNYQNRNAYLSLSPRSLQFGNALEDALGATSGGFRGSFGADGELIRNAMTYNVAVDVARNVSDPLTLLSADADALLRAGVAPDSVARLIAIAAPLGLSLQGSGVPGNRRHDAITWLGRLDDTRDTLQTRALTTYAGWTRDGGLGLNPLSAPSTSGRQKERTLGAQITLGTYVGPGRRVLTETRLAASQVRSHVAPYGSIPAANILVRSPVTGLDTDVTGLTLGGGSSLLSDRTTWTAEGSNLTVWNAGGSRHRFKAFAWARADGLRDEGISNGLGTFSFNSIADFQAGKASSFSRTLLQPTRDGRVWNAAAAFAHQYVPSRYFSFLYGARVERDGFLDSPARNPALEQALGVKTGIAPGRLHVSPRMGFTYMYNRDKNNGNGMNVSNVGRFIRTPTGTIRGGIGEFRDLLRPGILGDAVAATGLPGATSSLYCVGSATPAVDWTRFAADASSIPSQCSNGSGPLAENTPSVTLIDPSYDVPRSWRASVDWVSSVSSLLVRAGGLVSYDLSQPGTVDANFSGTQRFTLANEAARPVFVSTAAIDPASGSVSAVEARRSPAYGRVGERVSDLRGYGGQLTFGISPDVFKFRGRFQIYSSLGYTLQWSRRQFRGFDGAALGDPRVKEWSAGPNDARHVLVFTGGFATPKTGTITFAARAQSGLPFTPIVQGDINGDGRGGDRAFVSNPASETDAALASGIQKLLSSGSSVAHDCLASNLGRVAGRNSCRGPWTQSLNVQWSPPLPQSLRRRITPNVYLENVLSRSQVAPNPVLLIPRGFDASAQRFKYDVNPRFADTRTGTTMSRAPFRVILDFTMNLSVDYSLQKLRRAVEPVKVNGAWERRSPDSLAAFYLSRTSDVFKALIDQSDSLFLTRAQVTALQKADSVYSARVRGIYVPLGQFLAGKNGDATKAQLDSANATEKLYWTIFWEQPEVAGAIVTPSQRELMPMVKAMMATPLEDRKHSQWQFGYPVTLTDKPGEEVAAERLACRLHPTVRCSEDPPVLQRSTKASRMSPKKEIRSILGKRLTVSLALLCAAIEACSGSNPKAADQPSTRAPAIDTSNIYARTGAADLSATAKRARPLVYVPNSKSASVTVIDPAKYSVIRTFATGKLPQHVVPAYDLATLWVANNDGNSLTPIDPVTGQEGKQVPVNDPYNMYFTPDGKLAIIVAERRHRLDFRDPHTMKLVQSVAVTCAGLDHMEFTNDGRYVVATCEFSGQLVKVDLATRKPVAYLSLLPRGQENFAQKVFRLFRFSKRKPLSPSMPQDIRSSPDGKVFYVADMRMNGVHLIDPHTFTITGFIKTGVGTHGLYPSRDGKFLYVTNRGWNTTAGGRHGPGSITVIDFAQRRIVANWPVPGGGSPDMGNVTADGKELWVSGRYDDEVYVFDTESGKMTHRIPVGREPHGLCVWPQPGSYSLGHTGNMR